MDDNFTYTHHDLTRPTVWRRLVQFLGATAIIVGLVVATAALAPAGAAGGCGGG